MGSIRRFWTLFEKLVEPLGCSVAHMSWKPLLPSNLPANVEGVGMSAACDLNTTAAVMWLHAKSDTCLAEPTGTVPTFKLDLPLKQGAEVWWVNTSNGTTLRHSSGVVKGGMIQVDTPPFRTDAALIVLAPLEQ